MKKLTVIFLFIAAGLCYGQDITTSCQRVGEDYVHCNSSANTTNRPNFDFLGSYQRGVERGEALNRQAERAAREEAEFIQRQERHNLDVQRQRDLMERERALFKRELEIKEHQTPDWQNLSLVQAEDIGSETECTYSNTQAQIFVLGEVYKTVGTKIKKGFSCPKTAEISKSSGKLRNFKATD